MKIYNLNHGQKKALFISLKRQYLKRSPMTENEERTMFELSAYFWQRNKGKHSLLSHIPKL